MLPVRVPKPVGGKRDVITDFSSAAFDLIDLSDGDAGWNTGGNQRFDYIGSRAFSGDAGELNFRNGVVARDMDGDSNADFQIKVNTSPACAPTISYSEYGSGSGSSLGFCDNSTA